MKNATTPLSASYAHTHQTIIISGINIVNGGPLTILQECLDYIEHSTIPNDYECIALVHDKHLFKHQRIRVKEYPKAKKHWINRIYYEYFYFKKIAKYYRPFLWLSLHDITPSIANVERVATYMHNPSPFNRILFKQLKFYECSYILFSFFYRYLYQINIHKNTFCIVQQQWLRDAFSKMYKIDPKKIIVARPSTTKCIPKAAFTGRCCNFFYPAFPRPFKAFETICAAVEILEKKGISNFRVKLTINGNESKYTHWVFSRYKHLRTIDFIGLLDQENMHKTYEASDCLLFPSRLETWGLPISEFKRYSRPMIIVDTLYAHETAAGAAQVAFFKQDDANELAQLMEQAINGDYSYFGEVQNQILSEPYASDWNDLFNILLH